MSSTASRGRFSSFRGIGFARSALQGLRRRLSVHGNVTLGVDTHIGAGSIIRSIHGLIVGDHVHVGRNCTIEVSGHIGDHVLMAANVGIVGRRDHAIDELGRSVVQSTWIGDRPDTPGDRVIIGSDVWIGYGAVILSGVHIADGAVVAAGAVVNRDVGPFEIVAGNPAVKVSERLNPDDRALHMSRIQSQSFS